MSILRQAGTKVECAVKGHLLNPLWLPRLERRRRRGDAVQKAVGKYLDRYAPRLMNIPEDLQAPESEPERIFSIWFQGENAAPAVVQACWRSIRANCAQELVVLDADTVFDWVDLPQSVVDKWRSGKMRPAHFADICRVDLLYRHGGVWMDATDFAAHPLQEEILAEPFFVYMSGQTQRGCYSFVQNCFIRGAKGDYLLKCWREAMLAYWGEEDGIIDYFAHQLLLKKVVECNPVAAEHFSRMPKVVQDPTHEIWFVRGSEPFDPDLFESLTKDSAFQKTEYKSALATNPPAGSMAAAIIEMFR